MTSDLGDAFAHDPEVRQARIIADAARSRLLACMSGPQEGTDLVEAQGMLDAIRHAQVLAADAEDRVLLHRGLLTTAEASERAADRRPVAAAYQSARDASRAAGSSRRPRFPVALPRLGGRLSAVRVIACLLGLGAAGVLLARWAGVRLPLARW